MELEIWSDIACPWCYIGKRRFEAALAQFEHKDELRITWRSFELDPEAPAERKGDLASLVARKYGMTVERARDSQRALTQTAAMDTWSTGIPFRETLRKHAADAGQPLDEARLDEVCRPERYLDRLAGVFDRVADLQ